ncbi:imidazole glycerol phosphate synthase subunit HisH [Populibacterium corticicola]|uniref:Imidazole glycerol phosphate synthase subunit HisH n=1 Tax=Populibacterium corticicola TaxID=1812826 RepID=A0ABW5XIJ7_9MICO
MTDICVLDYGFGNVRSAVRALEHVGATVTLTADYDLAMNADGLVVPGVGAFSAVMDGLKAVNGPRIIERRLAGGRPVLGICVGMQVMFDAGNEHGAHTEGLAQWPGTVDLLDAPVVPHMGWNTIEAPENTVLFDGLENERFYFVHSYAAQTFTLGQDDPEDWALRAPLVTWSTHSTRFVAAVENGALSATQFHPEKSADAGAQMLKNWINSF